MAIDLASLQKTIERFNAVLDKSSNIELMRHLDVETREAVISGVVRHFEFTYDSCLDYMKQWMVQNAESVPENVSKNDFLTLAGSNHLIDNVQQWQEFQAIRDRPLHPHEARSDIEVYLVVRLFGVYASRLFKVVDFRKK